MAGGKRSHAAADVKSPGTKRVAGGSSTRQTRTEYAKQVEAEEECDREARNTSNTGATPRGDNDIEHNNNSSGSIGSSSSCDSEDVGEDRAQPAAEGFTANQCKLMVDAIINTWHLPRLVQLLAHVAAVHVGGVPLSGMGPSVQSGVHEQLAVSVYYDTHYSTVKKRMGRVITGIRMPGIVKASVDHRILLSSSMACKQCEQDKDLSNLMTEVGDHNRTVWRQFWEMEAATVGGAVRKCGERLFRHLETSQSTKDVTNQAFKQFVKREFEAASKSLGAPSLRTAIGNPVGSLAFLVACAAGFDKDSVVDHQLKEGLAGKPVMPLLLVDHMAFTNFKLYYRLADLYRQVTGEKEPYKELMASNHNALMLQFREVLLKECKAFGWENIDNVRVCGMQGAAMAFPFPLIMYHQPPPPSLSSQLLPTHPTSAIQVLPPRSLTLTLLTAWHGMFLSCRSSESPETCPCPGSNLTRSALAQMKPNQQHCMACLPFVSKHAIGMPNV
ncbi:hypothetical protein QJQ45_026545, partial [Haematococcus lacustris]